MRNEMEALRWLLQAVCHAINASARVREMVRAAIARFQALCAIEQASA